jgi:hypothetical protein
MFISSPGKGGKGRVVQIARKIDSGMITVAELRTLQAQAKKLEAILEKHNGDFALALKTDHGLTDAVKDLKVILRTVALSLRRHMPGQIAKSMFTTSSQ